VVDAARPEPAPPSDRPVSGAAPAPAAEPPGPPHLADARALTILTTEHWGLLTARSLVYNEAFSRGAMFLTFLSASLVALGFVSGGRPGADFALVVIAVLALDLFIGLATLGRLIGMGREEFQALQAMNRLRHAYLEMVPTLDPYMSTGRYDDARSVMATYDASQQRPTVALGLLHGLTTMPGMIAVLDAALAGAVAAAVAVSLGGDTRAALAIGVTSGAVVMVLLFAVSSRVILRQGQFMPPRFPDPGAAGQSRRNT
jgi:hypothetical protein